MDVEPNVEAGSHGVRRALEKQLDRVREACPGLSSQRVRSCCLTVSDAVILSALLDGLDEPVEVFDVGGLLGVTTSLFASHASVRTVTTIDRTAELSGVLGVDPAELVDAVRSTMARFPDAQAKVTFVTDEGGAATRAAPRLSGADPAPSPSGDQAHAIALVDGRRTPQGVLADLEWLLAACPEALVLLDDCRGDAGPYVQGGVAQFLTAHPDRLSFHLLADLAPGFGASRLGVLYPRPAEGGLPEPLVQLVNGLSTRLDPLTQLEREQELVARTVVLRRELTRAEGELKRIRASPVWRMIGPIYKASGRAALRRTADRAVNFVRARPES